MPETVIRVCLRLALFVNVSVTCTSLEAKAFIYLLIFFILILSTYTDINVSSDFYCYPLQPLFSL